MMKICVLAALVACSSAALFSEEFGTGWEDRWTQSTAKEGLGAFVASGDAIKTSEDAKFYGLVGKFDTFSNEGKKLIVQFVVKHEQNIDCGGGYVKVFPSTEDAAKLDMESYNLMFGPDICGPGTRKVHVIFEYNGKQLQNKKSIACKFDEASHLYTLIVNPDNTYEVQIDGKKEEGGSLYEDFDFLLPKEINDPEVSKPADWVDETQIDDPEDTKPEDWVTEKQIVDPEAEQPEDWDEEMDGEWEAPTIDNPDYKGDFKAKRIDNPEYKGEWVHPQVANPEFVDDDAVYDYADFGAIAFDLWQVKSGTVFDSVLITSDEDEAAKAVEAFKAVAKEEEAAKKAAEDEAKKAEEAKKAAEEESTDDEEDEEGDEASDDEEPKKDEL
jgi:calreticulin